ncbi:MAG: PQQ-binding-like beta-propeller repeat protein [Verrucomicrobia bacterium]|nr:PQQ-binding-like beta-propeller repeat protein [Verrucomicrobiota bacterium]
MGTIVASAEPWKRHTIDAASKADGKLGADGVRLADANGDGLLDVVTAWENGDAIRVCLNPGPEKSKEPWPAVTVGRVAGGEDAVFVDLDGDGAMDVVTSTEGKTQSVFVHWAPLEKDRYLVSEAWETETVPALEKKGKWMFALPFDVNGDGRVDLIFGSKSGGASVGWLESPKGDRRDLSQWTYHRLYEAGWIMSIRAVDLDGDGDQDVVFSDRKGKSSGVWWLEKVGGPEFFAKPVLLGFGGEEVMFLDIVDRNYDKRLDIVVAVRLGQIGGLYQPEKASETWIQDQMQTAIPLDRFGTAKAIRVADIDGDGSLNHVVTCERAEGDLSGCFYIAYDEDGSRASKTVLDFKDIGGPEGVKFDRIELIDLDGDGDLDLMTCEERDNLGVFWYENPAKTLSGKKEKRAAIGFFVLVLLWGLAGLSLAENWPNWMGPGKNGIVAKNPPADLEKINWRVKIGIGFSSVVVVGDRLITMGHDGKKEGGRETVWCLDVKTGKVVWSDSYAAPLLDNLHVGGPAATPLIDGDRVYTLSRDGQLHCYSLARGKRLWQVDMKDEVGMSQPPEWGFSASPLVLGERLIIEAGATFCLEKKSGKKLWKSKTYRPAYGTPAAFQDVSGRECLAVLKTDGLVVLDMANGKSLAFTKWESPFNTNSTTPIVTDKRYIFISTGYDRGCALFDFSAGGLKKVYEKPVMSNHMNNSVLVDGHLYGFDGTAHRGRPSEFVCMDLKTGNERWRVGPERLLGCGSLIVCGKQLVILTERGELIMAMLSPDKFELNNRVQVLGGLCWTPPVLAGGHIYCRNSRGDLVSVGNE